VVTEFCPCSLQDLLLTTGLSWKVKEKLVLVFFQALEALHKKGRCHGDLGLWAIRFRPSGELVIDAGRKRETLFWMAPESFTKGSKSTCESDIYSSAMLLYEMMTDGVPAAEQIWATDEERITPKRDYTKKIMEGWHPQWPTKLTFSRNRGEDSSRWKTRSPVPWDSVPVVFQTKLKELFEMCTLRNPKERPTVGKIISLLTSE
jgi:serine/threonine protein kinase